MTAQLGFADLLTEAAATNEQRQMDRTTAHLPGTMEEVRIPTKPPGDNGIMPPGIPG
jgi:hypothetical protein